MHNRQKSAYTYRVLQSIVHALSKQGSCCALQVFEGESVFHYQQTPSANVEVPLALKRDAAVTVMIKV